MMTDAGINRKPLYDVEAEQAVLGCVLLDPATFSVLKAQLDPDQFGLARHQTIYRGMLSLEEDGREVECLALRDVLMCQHEPREDFETAGDCRLYLMTLMQAPATSKLLAHYASIVRDGAARRQVLQRAQEAYTLAAEGNMAAISAAKGYYNLGDIIANSAAANSIRPVCMADVEPEIVTWLWRRWIPMGKISMIVGDPGLGKSILSLDLASRVTTGQPMPYDNGPALPPADVLLLLAEDGLADTVRPRLTAAGADLKRVRAYKPEDAIGLLSDLARLEAGIRDHDTRMVIIDPLMAFFPSNLDSHKDQHARRVLSPLSALAQRTGAAIVLVHHPNKPGGYNVSAIHRAGGSIGIIGAARAALVLARDPDDRTKCILASLKNNLSRPAQSLRISVGDADEDTEDEEAQDTCPVVVWAGVADGQNADELLSSILATPTGPNQTERAMTMLRDILADGPVASSELEKQILADGISRATYKRARKDLGVATEKVGGPGGSGYWMSSLPPPSAPAAKASQSGHAGQEDTTRDSPSAKGINSITSNVLLPSSLFAALTDPPDSTVAVRH